MANIAEKKWTISELVYLFEEMIDIFEKLHKNFLGFKMMKSWTFSFDIKWLKMTTIFFGTILINNIFLMVFDGWSKNIATTIGHFFYAMPKSILL